MMLKCNRCGNVYSSDHRKLGGMCGVNRCTGTLVFYANVAQSSPSTPRAKLDLKCTKCGNVYSSASGRRIFGTCGVGGCDGTLDRYWG